MPKELVIITGLSGAGKSLASHVFEDLKYYCIDNIPPNLMPDAARLWHDSNTDATGLAFVVDTRSGDLFERFVETFDEMKSVPVNGFSRPKVLFLDASDDVLIKRFKETRRRHPLVTDTRGIIESINYERNLLMPLRERADKVIDTSNLEPISLRKAIESNFSTQRPAEALVITVVSFGFKHGIPLDADLVFDVRFLTNPHYVEQLQPYDGNSQPVRQYVLSDPLSEPLMEKLFDLVEFSIPQYAREGKAYLTIAIGCTGGRHRSVVLANELARFLENLNYTVIVEHRDIGLGKK
ncbi:MAG: RNase adapter RapZ [Armatimonadetes bacterium]|nr:RNase adapter RapZ [Armatimonadota bacterium]